MILFRKAIFSDYSPFGSTVGLKNSLSVYLAQIVPLFLIALEYYKDQKGIPGKLILLFGFVGVTLSAYVIVANRTRSAWLMLITTWILLFIAALRCRKVSFSYFVFSVSIVLAVAGVAIFPNALKWSSQTPYADSLLSLTSFEKSSGRDVLWEVAIEMISHNLLSGIGTGQYSALWNEHIQHTNVDPYRFAFMRPDLPLFNDYLQLTVNNGIIIGGIFSFAILGLCVLLIRNVYSRKPPITYTLLSCIILSTCVDALTDYPFRRAETVLVFAVALGYLYRHEPSTHVLSNYKKSFTRFVSIGLVFFSSYVVVLMSVGLYGRWVWRTFCNQDYLITSIKYWPWDCQLDSSYLNLFESIGDKAATQKYVERRLEAWPFDPESHYIAALYNEHNKNYDKAYEYYTRAISYVKNGRCYKPAYESYLKFLENVSMHGIYDAKHLQDQVKYCL